MYSSPQARPVESVDSWIGGNMIWDMSSKWKVSRVILVGWRRRDVWFCGALISEAWFACDRGSISARKTPVNLWATSHLPCGHSTRALQGQAGRFSANAEPISDESVDGENARKINASRRRVPPLHREKSLVAQPVGVITNRAANQLVGAMSIELPQAPKE